MAYTRGNSPSHVMVDDATPLPDSLKALAAYNLADVLQTNSVSAAVPNAGAFTGNITTSGTQPISQRVQDQIIQGEMLTCNISIDDYEDEQGMRQVGIDWHEHMKKRLINQLANEMMNSKHIEFTRQHDYHQNRTIYRARAYVTPDSQVRLLRENGVK